MFVLVRDLEQTDSDAFIHYIVVDHYGHSFLCNSEEFSQSVNIVDEHMKRIAKTLGENTLFIVQSDHGMSCDKYESHGGTDPEHRATFFFAYSTTKPFVNEQVLKDMD